jgi:hypothetical protein
VLRRTCQARPQLTARIMARIGDVRTGLAETRPPIVDRLVEASDISPISALLSRMIDDCDDLVAMSARLGACDFRAANVTPWPPFVADRNRKPRRCRKAFRGGPGPTQINGASCVIAECSGLPHVLTEAL